MDEIRTIAQGRAAMARLTTEMQEINMNTKAGRRKVSELTARMKRISKIIKECQMLPTK